MPRDDDVVIFKGMQEYIDLNNRYLSKRRVPLVACPAVPCRVTPPRHITPGDRHMAKDDAVLAADGAQQQTAAGQRLMRRPLGSRPRHRRGRPLTPRINMSNQSEPTTPAEPQPKRPLSAKPEEVAGPPPAAVARTGRVVAIDALRGFDMFFIIGGEAFLMAIPVLFGQAVPAWLTHQMEHSPWIGFTAEDIIMPLFLFIVGVVMPFSFAKRLEQGQSKTRLHVKVIIRTLILFVLGMAAQGNLLDFQFGPDGNLQIFCNTLQAIAAGYLVSAVLILNVSLIWQILATAASLLSFWAVLAFVPVPGHAAGTLDPDCNIALYIEQAIFGRFFDPTIHYTWVLSSLGFIGTTMLGVFAGQILRGGLHKFLKFFWLLVLCGACFGGGWLWSLQLPIIKHLWTPSMVLWSAGWCCLLLATFYLITDVIGFRWWAFPFVVIGANSIFVYMVTRLINFRCISDPFVAGLARHMGDFCDPFRDVAALAVIWLILLYMYRKKTFIRI
jgi:predicted acyltransferase